MRKLRVLIMLTVLFSMVGSNIMAQTVVMKEIRVDREGKLSDVDGKPIDWRLFAFTCHDKDAKNCLEKSKARFRKERMYIDEALLKSNGLDDKKSAHYAKYKEWLDAELQLGKVLTARNRPKENKTDDSKSKNEPDSTVAYQGKTELTQDQLLKIEESAKTAAVAEVQRTLKPLVEDLRKQAASLAKAANDLSTAPVAAASPLPSPVVNTTPSQQQPAAIVVNEPPSKTWGAWLQETAAAYLAFGPKPPIFGWLAIALVLLIVALMVKSNWPRLSSLFRFGSTKMVSIFNSKKDDPIDIDVDSEPKKSLWRWLVSKIPFRDKDRAFDSK